MANCPTETTEQIRVVEYCEKLGLPVFHIPNGFKASKGYRFTLYRMGLRSGVPDLFIPVPKGSKHGLFIEMKRRSGSRTTDKQKEWQKRLNAQGYVSVICKGYIEALDAITDYMLES